MKQPVKAICSNKGGCEDKIVTLLLTCVTHRFVVQASDRRLTLINGDIHEEIANKALLLGNHATFAYTGLSKCSITESTDLLLLRSLAEPAPIIQQLGNLGKNAGRSIRHLPLPGVRPSDRGRVRRTSFVGGGFFGLHHPELFGRRPSVDNLHPSIAVVSNAQGISERWRDVADREFSVSIMSLEHDQEFGLHAAGVSFGGVVRKKLNRAIRSCIARSAHPELVARLLARAIREISKGDRRVGPNVMCTLVHRDRVLQPPAGYSSGAIPASQSQWYRPEADYFRILRGNYAQYIYSPGNPADLVYYGPNWTANGLMIQGPLFGPSEQVNRLAQDLGRRR
jgi:hypothetical protein